MWIKSFGMVLGREHPRHDSKFHVSLLLNQHLK
ncbi:unnamed protein product, partial [Allacma fusca]